MKWPAQLSEAVLLKRHYRFLMDVYAKHKKRRMIYCPSLRLLKQCDILGTRVWYSAPSRLSDGYLDIWELAEVDGGEMVCVNPQHALTLVQEAIDIGIIKECERYHVVPSISLIAPGIERFVREDGKQCFMYIQPVMNPVKQGQGYFPEELSKDLQALRRLIALREEQQRVILFFCVMHSGVQAIYPADEIDPIYASVFREAIQKGVEVLAYKASISLSRMRIEQKIPVSLTENILLR